MKLDETVAIVTGGASGLGGATVRNFAAGGAKVAIFDLNREKGEALATEFGENARFFEVNVTDESSVQKGIAGTLGAFGRITANVNCAGIAIGLKTLGKDGAHSLETFKKVIDINLVGSFNVLRFAAAEMAKNEPNEEGERGVIINTVSVAAYEGQ